MSNDYNPSQALSELFVDATREVIERNRIRSQMNRILRIMEADKSRLRNAYAEIGRMYCEGTLEKNKARTDMVYDTIDHLKQRLERAKLRYEQLQEAHSVDECTVAFRQELESKVKQAQQFTMDAARDLGAKAKSATGDLPDKAQETLGNIKVKATNAAGKAKAAVEEVASRASAAVARIGSSDPEELPEDATMWEDMDDLSDITEDEDDSYIEEYTEEDQAAAADIGAILGSIASTLESVDQADAPAESASASDAPAEEAPADGESPESFDF